MKLKKDLLLVEIPVCRYKVPKNDIFKYKMHVHCAHNITCAHVDILKSYQMLVKSGVIVM